MSNIESIRNVILCGHGSAGKTTLADSFLTLTDVVKGSHSVEDGTSICDFDPEEKKHKYSIEAAAIHFDHGGFHFNVIDTPGYPDFIGQVMGPMQAVDNAAIVINAHRGIEVNTRRVFKEATHQGLGRIIVINKMDDETADYPQLLESIRQLWGKQCLPLNVPIGSGDQFTGVASTLDVPEDFTGALLDPSQFNEPLIESIIEVDDAVMERYFEGIIPKREEVHGLIVSAVKNGTLVPIVCCSAKTGVGVAEVLDSIGLCGLSPIELIRSSNHEAGQVPINPDANGPLVAKVFRTRIDPFVQKLNFIRVFSGTMRRDDSVHASGARKNIKLGPLLEVQGESTEPVDFAGPGDIVAIAKMEDLHTGTVLGDLDLPETQFPSPMVSLAVLPRSRGDETKLSGALHKVLEEDPTFHLDRDAQTKELVMTGMSELHLNVIQERLIRRDKLEVETKEPRIAFRETILGRAEGDYRHRKQSGGRGQFGEIHVRIQPLPRGTDIKEFATKKNFHSIKNYHYDEKSNFLWVDSVVGGVIPGNFMPAIGKGFAERVANGVIAGYPVQDVCVEVHFGKHHQVDSSEAAFKTAAKHVFKKVFEAAKPSLLEPIVKLDVTVPESNMGDVYSDISGRGGHVLGSDRAGNGYASIHCDVPLREITTYARTLSSMTGGLGSFTMEFAHYDTMPSNVQHELMAANSADHDEDE
ncbi:MAG: elongation factor G [Mariniblastus sp.]|nr:elongation factor G [Mariniblastus sp.]